MAARSFARRVGLEDWREVSVMALRKQLALSFSSDVTQCANAVQSLLYSESLSWMTDSGFSQDESDPIDLAADFSKLLIWEFYPGFLALDEVTSVMPLIKIIELHQQHADRTYLLFRSCLNKLHRFLLAAS